MVAIQSLRAVVPVRTAQWRQVCLWAIVAAALALGLLVDVVNLGPALTEAGRLTAGGDLYLYQRATQHWLAGGGFYPTYQLTSPYSISGFEILYPPIALALFLPSLHLPTPLWWILPFAIVLGTVIYWRPRPWGWAAVALCAASYPTIILVHQGNPAMWIAAAVAVGTVWRPAAAFVVLKPSLFPLAFFGVRDRGWWFMAALFVLVSLMLLPMDLEWLRVLLNARGPHASLLYSATDLTLVGMPLVAWIARGRGVTPS